MTVFLHVCSTSVPSPTVLRMKLERRLLPVLIDLGKRFVIPRYYIHDMRHNHPYVNGNLNRRYPITNCAVLRNKQTTSSYVISHLALCNHRHRSALHTTKFRYCLRPTALLMLFLPVQLRFDKGNSLITISGCTNNCD